MIPRSFRSSSPALKDPEVRLRDAAAQVLCHLNDPKGPKLLLQYAKAPNPEERASAIRALVDQQPSEVCRFSFK